MYLLKRPAFPLAPAPAGPSFTCEHYMVLLHEGRGGRGGLRWWTQPWHALSTRRQRAAIDARLARAIDELTGHAQTCASLLSDVLDPVALSREEVFTFVRRLCNYVDWKADAAPLKYDGYLDYFVADSTLECHRSYLRVDDYYVKTLTMKEPPSGTYAHMLDGLH